METAEAIEFLRRLRTVRRFTEQPVPQTVLDDLLTVARWSGSATTASPGSSSSSASGKRYGGWRNWTGTSATWPGPPSRSSW